MARKEEEAGVFITDGLKEEEIQLSNIEIKEELPFDQEAEEDELLPSFNDGCESICAGTKVESESDVKDYEGSLASVVVKELKSCRKPKLDCQECGKSIGKNYLKQHMSSVHNIGVVGHECDKCHRRQKKTC